MNMLVPLRRTIEEQVVEGRTWAQVARSLPRDAGISVRNVRDHFAHGHLPITAEAVQQLADRQAHERRELVARAAAPVASHLAF